MFLAALEASTIVLGHGAPVSSHVEMRGLVLLDRAGVVLFLHAIEFVCVCAAF